MIPEADACYRALLARDPRFDGVFFTAVRTTGIYCRPVCRARTPRRSSCTFYRTAAEAEAAGYRACLRCRPELAPGASPVDAVPHLVGRAVRCIAAGALNERGLEHLAASLGVTDRHLRRAVQKELGISPVQLAQTRRLALAKQLLHDTDLDLAHVAFASGFASVRRFNALFRERFGRPPSALRRDARTAQPAAASAPRVAPGIRLVLDHRPPLDWDALLAFLAPRAVAGVERVAGGAYERVVALAGATGVVRVRPHGRRPALVAEVPLALAGALMPIAAKLRALFDLDADPVSVDRHLARDPALAPLVARHPGLRVPGAFDPFEMAVRAVLGQQVSVRAATTLAGRLAAAYGSPCDDAMPTRGRAFPTAVQLAAVPAGELAALGLTGARAQCLAELARACADGRVDLAHAAGAETRAALARLPGFGPWTIEYIAMRALADPDAFPAGDLGVRKALARGGREPTPIEATARAAAWSPWRRYAVMHLWTRLTEGDLP